MTKEDKMGLMNERLKSTLAGAGLAGLLATTAAAQTVATDKETYAVGEAIVVSFGDGPGNAKDWIGIYPVDIVPGDVPATLWQYVDGTTAGESGLSDGTVNFEGGFATAGEWVAYLLENDGYAVLAEQAFSVEDVVVGGPRLELSHFIYRSGEDIEVRFLDGPGNPKDWVGLYPEGIVPGEVPSTRWLYVDGTTDGITGFTQGSVVFPGGLTAPGNWNAFLLENDGYTQLAQLSFNLVNPESPDYEAFLRADRSAYAPGEPITLSFLNAPGNAKDWIGVYGENDVPGEVGATIWLYVDGTDSGSAVVWDGEVTFPSGLSDPGLYVAYLLENDGYTVWAREAIRVEAAQEELAVVSMLPSAGSSGNPPRPGFTAVIRDSEGRTLVPESVRVELDGAEAVPTLEKEGTDTTVSYIPDVVLVPNSSHTYRLTFEDDADPAGTYAAETSFTVADYPNILLPEPIVFEDFDGTPEDSLPAGWTEKSYTDALDPLPDLENLDSASFASWLVIDVDRFEGAFYPYGDYDNPTTDYQRVLRSNPMIVVNGELIEGPLASGRMLFGNSGYRTGESQVLYCYSPDFDLGGQSDLHVAYHSLYEQNQDSFGAVEYSVDGGATWLPIVYLIDGPDVFTLTDPETGEEVVDAVTTLETEHDDVARFLDDDFEQQGGYYGAFIGAPISQELAPYISPRVDDDPVTSKRVELFRLPAADNQSRVRFRFAYAGTDSWYFGVDDFGLYSIPESMPELGPLSISLIGDHVTISWSEEVGPATLESSPSLGEPNWTEVEGVAGNSIAVPATGEAQFFRLTR